MGDITCNNCGNAIDTKNISACPNCGAILCADCARFNSNLCPHCFETLNFLS